MTFVNKRTGNKITPGNEATAAMMKHCECYEEIVEEKAKATKTKAKTKEE